ncbi:MAG: hypothetical protein ACPGMR_03355 [Pontibacterium sp.]
MAKKTEAVTTHLSHEQREQIARIAKIEGFGSTSEYLRHLAQAAIEEKRVAFTTLSSIFSDDEGSNSSVSSHASQFLRGVFPEFPEMTDTQLH